MSNDVYANNDPMDVDTDDDDAPEEMEYKRRHSYMKAKPKSKVKRKPRAAPKTKRTVVVYKPAPKRRAPAATRSAPKSTAASRATEIKMAHQHLRRWKKMVDSPRNGMADQAWLDEKIDALEMRLMRLLDDERRGVYGSASTQASLTRRTMNLNQFWIPKVLAGIEQRNMS